MQPAVMMKKKGLGRMAQPFSEEED